MSDCGHECHMVGGPWIAENPDCPIHGVNGMDPDDARDVIRDLIEALEGHRNAAHCSMGLDDADEALIERARSFL